MAEPSEFEPLYCYDDAGNAYLIGGPQVTLSRAPVRGAVCRAWVRPVAIGRRLTFGRATRRPGRPT